MTSKPWWKEPTREQWAAFTAAWVGWVLDAFDFMVYVVVDAADDRASSASRSRPSRGSLTLTLLVRLAGGCVRGLDGGSLGPQAATDDVARVVRRVRRRDLLLALVHLRSSSSARCSASAWVRSGRRAPRSRWRACRRRMRKHRVGPAPGGLADRRHARRRRRVCSSSTSTRWRPMFLIGSIPAVLTIPLWFMFPSTKPAPRVAGAKRSRGHASCQPGRPADARPRLARDGARLHRLLRPAVRSTRLLLRGELHVVAEGRDGSRRCCSTPACSSA